MVANCLVTYFKGVLNRIIAGQVSLFLHQTFVLHKTVRDHRTYSSPWFAHSFQTSPWKLFRFKRLWCSYKRARGCGTLESGLNVWEPVGWNKCLCNRWHISSRQIDWILILQQKMWARSPQNGPGTFCDHPRFLIIICISFGFAEKIRKI